MEVKFKSWAAMAITITNGFAIDLYIRIRTGMSCLGKERAKSGREGVGADRFLKGSRTGQTVIKYCTGISFKLVVLTVEVWCLVPVSIRPLESQSGALPQFFCLRLCL